jgi:hypothetical protein
MPRQTSELLCNPSESVESVLKRAPSSTLNTPAANKPVTIRPLKRMCLEGQQPVLRSASTSPEPIARKELSPRKLDMDQEVILACQAAGQDDDEDELVEVTQPYVAGEVEEGEIPVLARTDGPGDRV